MSVAGPGPDTTRKFPVFSHGVAAFARKDPCHAFCWRPRPDLQLPRSRKPHPISDLEWWYWARSTHRTFPLDRKYDRLWQEVETQTWTVGDTPAGTWVSSRNLTYVKVVSNVVFLVGAKCRFPTDFQRIAYGRVRPITRNARHDTAVHGHEFLCHH